MIIKNASKSEIIDALQKVNEAHGYQLIFNRGPEPLNQKRTRWRVTIRSKHSKIPGARIAPSGRNLIAASWHAHGYFFDRLIQKNPFVSIQTGRMTIDSSGGNWQNFNTGSQMRPVFMSETSIL